MLNSNSIRVLGALGFSIVVHVVLMGLDSSDESVPVAGIVRQKVSVQLIARRAPAKKPVVVSPKPERKNKQASSVLPLLARPIEVAIREIPAVSLPTAPIVPKLVERAEETLSAKPEQVEAISETKKSSIVMARPLYRENPPPEYPAQARHRHLQGTVVLEVAVTKDGKVAALEISEGSGHKILDRAALRAVKEWVFEPGQRSGRRVSMRVLVPVRFRLQ